MGPDVLLTARGRECGQPRARPVAICAPAGRHGVISRCGEINWVRNLRAAGHAPMMVGRRSDAVIAVELGFPHAHSATVSSL